MARQVKGRRPRRGDRGGGGGRQHLPRPGRRRARSWIEPPATTWACSPPCSTPWRYRTRSRRRGHTRVQSAITISEVAEPYIRRRGDAPPRAGPHRDPCRRHRQSVLHHRHGRGAESARDPRGSAPAWPRTGWGRVHGGPAIHPEARFLADISHGEAIEHRLPLWTPPRCPCAWTIRCRFTCSTWTTGVTSTG